MLNKFNCLLFLLLWMLQVVLAPVAHAISANPNIVLEKQADGTSISLKLKGDERQHWYEDLNGYTVLKNTGTKNFEYAQKDNSGNLRTSGLVVGRIDPANAGLVKGVKKTYSQPSISSNPTPISNQNNNIQAVAKTGNLKNLVVLVRFANHTNRTLPSKADISKFYNNIGGDPTLAPSGSFRDFYYKNSYGKLNVTSDVTDWINVSQTEAYVSGVDIDPSCAALCSGRIWEAFKEALTKLDATIDLSQYDTDKDGYVDAVTFLHSGYAAEQAGTSSDGLSYGARVWSHKSTFGSPWVSTDSTPTKIQTYNTSPALWGISGNQLGRIGVVVHEFGHVLGMPDLYDLDYTSVGAGNYDVMGNSWGVGDTQLYPPNFSAWSKIKLGWITPTLINNNGSYTINQSATNAQAYKITQNFPSQEYLLIENRQTVDFDQKLPQGGLAIWHIDEKKLEATSNNYEGYPGQTSWPQNANHYRVALLQADGKYDLEKFVNKSDSSDLFHGAGINKLDQGPNKYPNTDTYQDGIIYQTGNTINTISNNSASMTFCLNQCNSIIQTPIISSPVNGATLTGSSATFTWAHRGTTVNSADIKIGNSVNASDIYDSGFLDLSKTSVTVNNLPTDGRTLYLRYSYSDNTGWHQVYYTYKAVKY